MSDREPERKVKLQNKNTFTGGEAFDPLLDEQLSCLFCTKPIANIIPTAGQQHTCPTCGALTVCINQQTLDAIWNDIEADDPRQQPANTNAYYEWLGEYLDSAHILLGHEAFDGVLDKVRGNASQYGLKSGDRWLLQPHYSYFPHYYISRSLWGFTFYDDNDLYPLADLPKIFGDDFEILEFSGGETPFLEVTTKPEGESINMLTRRAIQLLMYAQNLSDDLDIENERIEMEISTLVEAYMDVYGEPDIPVVMDIDEVLIENARLKYTRETNPAGTLPGDRKVMIPPFLCPVRAYLIGDEDEADPPVQVCLKLVSYDSIDAFNPHTLLRVLPDRASGYYEIWALYNDDAMFGTFLSLQPDQEPEVIDHWVNRTHLHRMGIEKSLHLQLNLTEIDDNQFIVVILPAGDDQEYERFSQTIRTIWEDLTMLAPVEINLEGSDLLQALNDACYVLSEEKAETEAQAWETIVDFFKNTASGMLVVNRAEKLELETLQKIRKDRLGVPVILVTTSEQLVETLAGDPALSAKVSVLTGADLDKESDLFPLNEDDEQQ